MYPTLTHFFQDVFGINLPLPIQSFGFFVALAFIAAAYLLGKELERKGRQGLFKGIQITVEEGKKMTTKEWLITGVIGFLTSYKLFYILLNYVDFAANPQAYLLSIDGNFLGGILGAGAYLYYKYREDLKLSGQPTKHDLTVMPHEQVGDITMTVALFSLIGAKVFHYLEYPETIPLLLTDPASSLFSGLTFYGGLLFGMATTFYFAKKYQSHPIHLFDAVAPGLILAYGLGRMGCHTSGDGDWGIENLSAKPNWLSFIPDWLWAYNYPNNVNNDGGLIPGCVGDYCHQLVNPVYPTPLYEIMMCLIIFGVLWYLRKKINIPGMIFSIYLVCNGIERYLIEQIRVNVKYEFLWKPTQAELIALVLILAGVFGFVLSWQNRNKWSLIKSSH